MFQPGATTLPASVDKLVRTLETEDLVIITAGPGCPEQKQYKIQRALLLNASEWFKKALTGEWKEAEQSRLAFPDTQPDVIEQFLCFLIYGDVQLPMRDYYDDPPDDQDQRNDYHYIHELLPIKVWVFADKYLLPKLQNQTMKVIHNNLREHYASTSTIAEALISSTPDSTLDKMMMNQLMRGVCGRFYERVDNDDMKQYGEAVNTFQDLTVLESVPGAMTRIVEGLLRRSRFDPAEFDQDLEVFLVCEDQESKTKLIEQGNARKRKIEEYSADQDND